MRHKETQGDRKGHKDTQRNAKRDTKRYKDTQRDAMRHKETQRDAKIRKETEHDLERLEIQINTRPMETRRHRDAHRHTYTHKTD